MRASTARETARQTEIGMNIKHCFAVLLLLLCQPAMAAPAAPMTVLGLPLGGNVKVPIRVCKSHEIGSREIKSICWVSPPFVYKKNMLGSSNIPDSNSLPSWAVNATFRLQVRTDGKLQEISAHTFSKEDYDKIQQSISSRFGAPTFLEPNGGRRAVWHLKEIHIDLACRTELGCETNFRTSELQAQNTAEAIAEFKKNAARPVAP